MTRELLPNRRYSESFDLAHLGIRYSGQVGFYDDGRVGEVFLGMEKAAGTAMDVTARDAAVLISMALQHGVPIDRLRYSVTKDENGQPEGLIGALLELLARWQPKTGGWHPQSEVQIVAAAPAVLLEEGRLQPALDIGGLAVTAKNARDFGYTGDQCLDCQNFTMVRNGICLKCTTCGATTSCS